jgi:DnaJ-class molecular chaperone
VAIPAGIEEGQQIRLKGQGELSSFGGQAGDAIVTLHIGKHPQLRVDGRDLRLDLPITLYEAVLGGKVEAPTLDGNVELTIPRHSNGGRTLRLRGKGLPAGGGKPAGDLLVALRIVLPEGDAPELVALAERLRNEKPYDPRK